MDYKIPPQFIKYILVNILIIHSNYTTNIQEVHLILF